MSGVFEINSAMRCHPELGIKVFYRVFRDYRP